MPRFPILSVALLVASAAAQTFTSCNPLNSTCPTDPALGTTLNETYTADMTEFNPELWNVTAGTSLISFGDNGAEFALASEGDSVTVQSNFYIFWGRTEIIMKAAPGQGIISTAILLSDDLDEIDLEIKGGNTTTVENNWYGWGDTSQINSEYPALQGAQSDFHNYTFIWTQESIQWYNDGALTRTLNYAEPSRYPQTPCRFSFGMWCAGCSSQNGTVQWAGGKPDWSQGPFTMSVKSVTITDGTTNASTYAYGDHTGSYKSIQVEQGRSQAYLNLHKLSKVQSAEKQWNGLSTGAKIGIGCGVLGGFLIAFIAFTIYCVKQRKAGREEAAIQEKEWDAQNAELMEYRTMMAKGHFAVSRQSVMMDVKPTDGRRF